MHTVGDGTGPKNRSWGHNNVIELEASQLAVQAVSQCGVVV